MSFCYLSCCSREINIFQASLTQIFETCSNIVSSQASLSFAFVCCSSSFYYCAKSKHSTQKVGTSWSNTWSGTRPHVILSWQHAVDSTVQLQRGAVCFHVWNPLAILCFLIVFESFGVDVSHVHTAIFNKSSLEMFAIIFWVYLASGWLLKEKSFLILLSRIWIFLKPSNCSGIFSHYPEQKNNSYNGSV